MNNQKIITKSVNEEKRLATFMVLEPSNEDGTTNDLHLDWYSEATVEDACYSFNKFCMKANILHMMDTTAFTFLESYITLSEFSIGEQLIKKGSWLATIYVEDNESGEWIWKGIKDGTFDGLSVQAMGTVYDIEEQAE